MVGDSSSSSLSDVSDLGRSDASDPFYGDVSEDGLPSDELEELQKKGETQEEEKGDLEEFGKAVKKLTEERHKQIALVVYNNKELDVGFVLDNNNKIVRLRFITVWTLKWAEEAKVGDWIRFIPIRERATREKIMIADGAEIDRGKHNLETKVDQITGTVLVKTRLAVPSFHVAPKQFYDFDEVSQSYRPISCPTPCWSPELGDVEDANGVLEHGGFQEFENDTLYEAWIALSMKKSPTDDKFFFEKNIHSIISMHTIFSPEYMNLIGQLKWTKFDYLKYKCAPSDRDAEGNMRREAEILAKFYGIISKQQNKLAVWNYRFGNVRMLRVNDAYNFEKYKIGQLVTFHVKKKLTEASGYFCAYDIIAISKKERESLQINILHQENETTDPNIEVDVVFPFEEQDFYRFYHNFCGKIEIDKKVLQIKVLEALKGKINSDLMNVCHIKRVLGRRVRLELRFGKALSHSDNFWHQCHFILKKVHLYEDNEQIGF